MKAPGGDNTLAGALRASFARHGGRKALSFLRAGRPETVLRYADLEEQTAAMARTLAGRGIGRQDRVALFLPKSLLLVVAHLAALRLGAVSVPWNPGLRKNEVAYLLGDASPALVLAGAEQERLLRELGPGRQVLAADTDAPYPDGFAFGPGGGGPPAAAVSPDDPAAILYTSGTTGSPKGAVLTQGNLVHDAAGVCRIWEIRAPDVLCHALPLFHIHGLGFALHTCLLAGAHVLLLDAFVPATVLDILGQGPGGEACTLFMGVPAMYELLMEQRRRRGAGGAFPHVRLWACGSAPLPASGFADIAACFGREPVEREGMTETGMNFSNPLHGTRKPGSIGRPLPDLRVRVVDPRTLEDVPAGRTGEIWLQGPSITPGYFRKPGETAAAFHQGWFRTGDLGHADGDGYFFLTDRLKHLIISGGENVSPQEVENVIRRAGGVQDCCVLGIADRRWGERVVAAVVPGPGAHPTPEGIQAFCKENLHPWKCPKQVLVVEQLARNAMGKVVKEKVAALFEADGGAPQGSTAPPPRTPEG